MRGLESLLGFGWWTSSGPQINVMSCEWCLLNHVFPHHFVHSRASVFSAAFSKMMFCQLYQELRGIQKENKSLCHASIWGIPHTLSSLLGHTHRTDAYYRVSGMACINFAKLSVFTDSIEAQNTFGLSTRANIPLTTVLCHPIWLQRMKASSPEKPCAKEPHVSQLVWRFPPGLILEGREPCKEEGAIVKQMVVSDEVTEEQEEISEHCTWKMGRSKAAAARQWKCIVFHNSVCDTNNPQKGYSMLL